MKWDLFNPIPEYNYAHMSTKLDISTLENPNIQVIWEDTPDNFTQERIKSVKQYFNKKYKTYANNYIDALPENWTPPKKKSSRYKTGTGGACQACNGHGKVDCNRCQGKGGTTCTLCSGKGNFSWDGKSCHRCGGSGNNYCESCRGTGLEECNICSGKGR